MFLGGGVDTCTGSLSWDDTRHLWDFRCSRLTILACHAQDTTTKPPCWLSLQAYTIYRIWRFHTQSNQVGYGLGTNQTRGQP